MEHIKVNGGELEGRSDGTGDPVLLIHGSIAADTYDALRAEPALAGFQLISYRRRGFSGSVHHTGPFSIKQQAEDALAVLRHFGIERAHVAGHSYGGVTALQLAQDAPKSVHSLIMLEPALFGVPSAEEFAAGAGPVVAKFEAGDREGAITDFLNLVFSEPDWRERIAPHLPADYFEQAVRDANTFFDVEFPALGEWSFGDEQAATISIPVLAFVGEDSSPFFADGLDLMKRWWPNMESVILPGASHNLQFANPSGAAAAMAAFFGKHPIDGVGSAGSVPAAAGVSSR